MTPDPVKNPKLVAASPEALALLDIAPEQVRVPRPSQAAGGLAGAIPRALLLLPQAERPEFVEAFAGNKVLPGSQPAAHCYCGHQ